MVRSHQRDFMTDRNGFTLTQVAQAAGVEWNTLRAWIQRKHIHLDGGEYGPGRARLMTRADVHRVAVMGALVDQGLHPALAWAATEELTDFAHGPLPNEPQSRNPGELFPRGLTVVAAYQQPPHGFVFSVERPEDWQKLVSPLGHTRMAMSATFVVANPIYTRVAEALDQAA